MMPRNSDLYLFSTPDDELGPRLGHGIPKGSLVLIEGPEGSGKSMMSQRLAYGMLRNGHTVTMVSTELSTKDFVDQMFSMNYNIARYMITGRLAYHPVYSLIGPMKDRSSYLETLLGTGSLYGREVTVIDSLSTLVGGGEEDVGRLLQHFKKVVLTDKTLILTAEPGDRRFDILRGACDVLLDLEVRKSMGGVRQMVRVQRFLRSRYKVNKLIEYRVEPGSGLVVDITQVS